MTNIYEILADISAQSAANRNIKYIIRLIDEIRMEKSIEKKVYVFNALISILEFNGCLQNRFAQYIMNLLAYENKTRLLTEVGILSNEGFFTELITKISHKIIPPLEDKRDLFFLIGKIFYRKEDYQWVNEIPSQKWAKLFVLAGIRPTYELDGEARSVGQIIYAARMISLRIAAFGMEPKLTEKLPELKRLKNPFLVQNQELNALFSNFKHVHPNYSEDDYKHLLVIITQCENYADKINKNKSKFGTSLALTNLMLRLQQNINRLRLLLELLQPNKVDAYLYSEVELFKILVTMENKKQDLWAHITSNFSLVLFQITEHTSHTAIHYITQSRTEYVRLFLAALGGGFIVAFFCLFKQDISHWKLPYFGQAFMYSLNYALAFILIYVTHATLATKHPAMTASFIAKSLDKHSKNALQNLAVLITKIIRSQFIAFIGNILMALLTAYLLINLINLSGTSEFIEAEKAQKLLYELSPFQSLALFYAALTGLCLFLSGLIAGFLDNWVHYHNIKKRIILHNGLRAILPPRKLIRFSGYIENHLGNIGGNFFLGIFLGSMATIGSIFGVPLDVRHITFASGNFGIAMATLSYFDWIIMINALVGILLIGFFNFIFSFGCAFFIAVRSRHINFKQTRQVSALIIRHFFKNPFDFFFPLKNQKTI